MKKNKVDATFLAITFLESLKDIAKWSNEQLLDYMNKNNAWELLSDDMLMRGLIGADIDDIVEIIGGYLTQDEQDNIISRYNSRLQYS